MSLFLSMDDKIISDVAYSPLCQRSLRECDRSPDTPGYDSTDDTEVLRADAKREEAILARIPTGRWGKPDDLQGATIFLASPASNYVTGTISYRRWRMDGPLKTPSKTMETTISLQTLLRAFSFVMVAGLSASNLAGQNTAGQVPSALKCAAGTTMSREQIIAEAEKMADVQFAQLAGKPPDIDWIPGVMWAGYADFSHISSKSTYADAIEQLGDKVHWTPSLEPKSPDGDADDLCIGQAFLDAYTTKKDPARLAPTQSRIDAVSDYIEKSEPANIPNSKADHLTWWWCDALFMAPPVHARLSALTKDPKYLNAMDKEWWKTADLLYDKDEHLFFRDKSYIGKLTKNGKKIFWTRGNGWVFAGLARTLTYIPKDYPSRARYLTIFQDMAAKLSSLQQADGTWRPSLLDPDEFPDPETSGTALDCFAYAWGINNGLLDRTTYLPVAAKAWAALLAARTPDGLLGYVQDVAEGPEAVNANGTQLYATGAFLMAAAELSKLAPIPVPPPPQFSIPSAENPSLLSK
jgi:rhamnogalacturonyl hydrolase YesR